MLIPNTQQTRLLTVFDAAEVESVYDSQPKLMLIPKAPGALPYGKTFVSLLNSGCYAYGSFLGNHLQAFAVFYPWPHLPATTLVLATNRPTGSIYNPQQSGLTAVFDAGLLHAETDARCMLFTVRSAAKKWNHNTMVSPKLGRFYDYRSTVAERLPKGQQSKFASINQLVLNSRPVLTDSFLICAIAPWSEPPLNTEPQPFV